MLTTQENAGKSQDKRPKQPYPKNITKRKQLARAFRRASPFYLPLRAANRAAKSS